MTDHMRDRQNAVLATSGQGQPPHHFERDTTCARCGDPCASGAGVCADCYRFIDTQEGRV